MPRRKVPRIRAEAGTVSIGGGLQAGMGGTVGPAAGTGWAARGCGCSIRARDPPALLAPGDIVRFHAERSIL